MVSLMTHAHMPPMNKKFVPLAPGSIVKLAQKIPISASIQLITIKISLKICDQCIFTLVE